MSRVIAAISLTVIMLALCITDRIVVNSTYDEMRKSIIACEETVGQKANKENTAKAKNTFLEKEGVLSLFVNHDILDEIGEAVARLEYLSGMSDTDYLSECAAIKIKLEYIKKDSGVNLHSIF